MTIPKARKLPSGKWFIQLRLDGDSISITESTERACVRKATAIKAAYIAQGPSAKPKKKSTITLKQGIEKYIENRNAVLSPSTLRGYKTIANTRFLSIEGRDLKTITNWQAVVNEEARTCSAKTLHNAWMLAATIIEQETGQRPKVTLPPILKASRPFLSPAQIDTFCEAVRGTSVEIPALLGLCSLRCSEILGLHWRDVDTEKATVAVSGARVRGTDGYTLKPQNKTQASARTVPIMPQLVKALQDAEQEHGPDDLVVPVTQQSLYTRINTICRKAGLPEVGVHGLRHSFASLAYHLNVPYRVAMEIGGWEDDTTMRKIYTHIADEAVKSGAAAFGAFYSKNANDNANG